MAWRNLDIDQLLIADLVGGDLRSACPNCDQMDTDLALPPRRDQSPSHAARVRPENRLGAAVRRTRDGSMEVPCLHGTSRF
jgi:hypothetical protein